MRITVRGTLVAIGLVLLLCSVRCNAQNLTTVTAATIQNAGVNLPAGKLCFQATDASFNPIAFRVGGGGQQVKAPYCTAIANGAISGFSVPNPANTAPANIDYTVRVYDSSGKLMLTYEGVQFTGATFNFDNYVPAAGLPLGASTQKLTVADLTVTNSCSYANVSGCGNGSTSNVAFTTLVDGATVTFTGNSAAIANSKVTLGGNRTLAVTNLVNGGTYTLLVIQDGAGSRGLTLGSGCTWKVGGSGAGAITPSTAAGAIDVLAFMYDGANCYANFRANFN